MCQDLFRPPQHLPSDRHDTLWQADRPPGTPGPPRALHPIPPLRTGDSPLFCLLAAEAGAGVTASWRGAGGGRGLAWGCKGDCVCSCDRGRDTTEPDLRPAVSGPRSPHLDSQGELELITRAPPRPVPGDRACHSIVRMVCPRSPRPRRSSLPLDRPQCLSQVRPPQDIERSLDGPPRVPLARAPVSVARPSVRRPPVPQCRSARKGCPHLLAVDTMPGIGNTQEIHPKQCKCECDPENRSTNSHYRSV